MGSIISSIISGFISGLSLGLTGSGGSILAVPLLVYFVGLDPHLAVGTSLVAVGITAIIGLLLHLRQGNVLFKIGFVMAIPSILGIYIGSYLNKAVEGPILLVLFAFLMIAMGIKMMEEGENKVVSLHTDKEKTDFSRILVLGFVVGIASGFFGVGGGFLIVPALTIGAGLKMHKAVGTSLFIIVLNGFAGLISYELQGRPIDIPITLLFVIGGFVGNFIGTRVAKSLSCKELKQVFALIVVIVAFYLIAINLPKVI
ncbi:sulfite exporter TauE/SafE family protein [Thermococcus sp. M39]|uniref:TSUP family transporter n=1 Tax=Thermococcus sp. M39 TaxID=1638262 RepID=UPI00143A64AF|nr:sulfite exporter TauE/SafE family protein [Thermococcus sp. M39]